MFTRRIVASANDSHARGQSLGPVMLPSLAVHLTSKGGHAGAPAHSAHALDLSTEQWQASRTADVPPKRWCRHLYTSTNRKHAFHVLLLLRSTPAIQRDGSPALPWPACTAHTRSHVLPMSLHTCAGLLHKNNVGTSSLAPAPSTLTTFLPPGRPASYNSCSPAVVSHAVQARPAHKPATACKRAQRQRYIVLATCAHVAAILL